MMFARRACEFSTVALALVAITSGPTFASGNLHSFARASDAKIDFRATPLRSTHDCKSLTADTTGGIRITSAELIAAKDGVPEHCRINGLIPQEVGFQFNFPVA